MAEIEKRFFTALDRNTDLNIAELFISLTKEHFICVKPQELFRYNINSTIYDKLHIDQFGHIISSELRAYLGNQLLIEKGKAIY